MFRTRLTGLLIAFAAAAPIALLAAPASATATTTSTTAATAATAAPRSLAGLPGGRSTYVISAFGGTTNHMYARVATYQFATNGAMYERVWAWRQDSITGGTANMKRYTGYTTSGCLRACPVRTPVNFQPAGAFITAYGTWYVDVYGHLIIHWSWGAYEAWRLDASQPGFVGASIWSSNQAIVKAWGFGSNWQGGGATMAGVSAADRLYGPLVQNAYGVPTQYISLGFHFPDYSRCTNGTCMQGKGVTAADKRTWYNTYLAGNPAQDGRKNYWNFQTGSVAQTEQPGTSCISSNGGGHTAAMLQVIDDSGRFRGWVGSEASLTQAYYGRAIVSSFASVISTMLTTLH